MERVRLGLLDRHPGGRACLCLGSWRLEAPVRHRAETGELLVPAGVMTRLPVTRGQRVGLKVYGRHFHLGPLLGIPVPAGPGPLTGGLAARAREALAQAMVPVFFIPRQVRPETESMPAFAHRGGRWGRCQTPLPDVIRLCALEKPFHPSPEDREALQVLQEHAGIPMVNRVSRFPGLELARALHFFADTRTLTAETRPLGELALARMLADNRRVLIGPERPGRTRVVCELLPDAIGADREGETRSYADVAGLLHDLLAWQGRERWVVRAASGRPTQRVQVTAVKDGHGEWRLTGGRPLPATLADAARRGIRALEAHFGLLGEVVLAMAADGEGRPWLLGAQPQPFPALGASPLDYARSLAMRAWAARQETMAALLNVYGEDR